MQYSPKLKTLTRQIKKLMKENDVAGFVVLHTPGFSEYFIHLIPSYSAAEWDSKLNGFKIKGKLEYYDGDRVARDKKLADTLNMFHHMSKVTGQMALNLMNTSKHADEAWNAEHGEGEQTSDIQQNN